MADGAAEPTALQRSAGLAMLRTLKGGEVAEAFFGCLDTRPSAVRDDPTLDDPSGDHVLNPDFVDHGRLRLKPAAVLLAVDVAQDEPTVTLTVRTRSLSNHAGQIAFPGGKLDQGEGPHQAALREAEEEIALLRDVPEVQGYLPTYASRTGYRVYPVVASLDGLPALKASPAEVDSIFQVPLRFLLDPAHARRTYRTFDGKRRSFYTYHYENRIIWGLTAGIVHHMSGRLLCKLAA